MGWECERERERKRRKKEERACVEACSKFPQPRPRIHPALLPTTHSIKQGNMSGAAQLDRRRANAPESIPIVFDTALDDESQASSSGAALPKRVGRTALEPRPICEWAGFCRFSCACLTCCDVCSSAHYTHPASQRLGLLRSRRAQASLRRVSRPSSHVPLPRSLELTLLLAYSYGPRQVRGKTYSGKAELNVEVRFAPFAGEKRRRPGKVSLPTSPLSLLSSLPPLTPSPTGRRIRRSFLGTALCFASIGAPLAAAQGLARRLRNGARVRLRRTGRRRCGHRAVSRNGSERGAR